MLIRAVAASLASLAVVWAASAIAPTEAYAAPPVRCLPQGSGAGQCLKPWGLATDFETGRLYVADASNNRVDVYEANGTFLFAFGWGVADGSTNALQTCTTTCFKGLAGSGAGQLARPTQIAVDNVAGSASRHDVYVGGNDFRVQKFAPDGSFLLAFGKGVNSGSSGNADVCTNAGAPTNVCGAGVRGGGVCQIYGTIGGDSDSISVGPAGNVFLADAAQIGPKESEGFNSRAEKFSPAGACLGETKLMGPTVALPKQRVTSFVVDGAEDAFLVPEQAGGGIRKYDLAAPETVLCSDPGTESNIISIGSTGAVFASQHDPRDRPGNQFFQVVTQYDSACHVTRRFGYGQIPEGFAGLAWFHSAEGDLFGSDRNEGVNHPNAGVRYLTIPPAGPLIAPQGIAPALIGNAKALIEAEVNPEGKSTEVEAQYVDQASFEAEGFANPQHTEKVPLTIGSGREFMVNKIEFLLGCPTASKQLIEEGKCLTPETTYHYRLVAINADGQGEGPIEGPSAFTTKEPLEIVPPTFATQVGAEGATLSAIVNPLGIPASGYFEIVDDEHFQQNGFSGARKVPDPATEAEIDFGSGEAPVSRSVTVSGLSPGTTYHYRLAATDALIDEYLTGPEPTLRTFAALATESCPANEAFRVGASAFLPDCRAFEMVSPLDKEGGDIMVLAQGLTGTPAVTSQSSLDGSRVAYGSYRALSESDSAPYTSEYVAARSADGWTTHSLNPPQGRLIKRAAEFENEYKAFSPDLCRSWIVPLAEPPLAPGAIAEYRNLYQRGDQLCGGAPDFEAQTTAQPEEIDPRVFVPELQGSSADGKTTVFAANASLEGSGAPAQPSCATDVSECQVELYAKEPGQAPRYLCVLPGGAGWSGECTAGTFERSAGGFGNGREPNLTGAVSADGRRIFWSDAIGSEGKIYLRENPFGEGGECSEAGAPCTIAVSPGSAHFWAAARDGSAAIYSSAGKLFLFTVAGEATNEIAGGFLGFLGAGEELGHVYFVAGEAIAGAGANSEGDSAQAGKPNLYLYLTGSDEYRFVGTLSSADASQVPGKGRSSVVATEPILHNGRTDATGTEAVFMSSAPLTGYDNTDAANGQADTEVFLYDAQAKGGAGQLLCVSCNPSGGRPAGADGSHGGLPFWVAGRVPPYENSLYAPRVIADGGRRILFESADSLALRDTNGKIDVYQWERAGTGGCAAAKASYSPAAEGCIDLISSGQSPRDSELLDSSEAGDDVFFTTLASLVSADYGLVDVYDARVGGGFVSPPAPAPECEGEACQHPLPAPAYETPSSSSYEGPGNVREGQSGPKKCAKGKHKVKQGGKVKCVKNKKKSHKAKARTGKARR